MRGLETIIRMNMTTEENETYDRELEERRLEAEAFCRANKRARAAFLAFLLIAAFAAFII